MPDLVDKVFDYTTSVVQGTTSVLNNGYSASKDAVQYSYDTSKAIGGSIVNGAKSFYGQVQEKLPSGTEIFTTVKADPPPPATVSGLIYDNISGYVHRNAKAIGIGLAVPTLGLTLFQMYRCFVPYQRYAKRLQGRYRYEVIFVVGSMNSTFVSKLVSDLNNRGYVVFVTVSDEQELKLVEDINDPDIQPLFVDYTNETTVKRSLLKLGQLLDTKIDSIADESYYNFKGVLAIPDYSKLPKLRKMEELSGREFIRITEMFFLKFNILLYNGILAFIRESNSRRAIVESYNGQKIDGGYAKLLFINFLVVPSNDNRRLIHNLSLDMSKIFFDKLYEDTSVSFGEGISRMMKKPYDLSMVDMASLDIILHKNHNSTLVSDYPTLQNIVTHMNKKLTPRDIHHKIYDLLNQQWLMKTYKIEN